MICPRARLTETQRLAQAQGVEATAELKGVGQVQQETGRPSANARYRLTARRWSVGSSLGDEPIAAAGSSRSTIYPLMGFLPKG